MRLICPNCQAQYEVADNAIPAGGRDVQCSNCGNTWYQMPLGANGAAPAARNLTPPAAPPAAPKVAAETPAPAPKVAEAKAAPAAAVAPPAESASEKPKPSRKAKAADAATEELVKAPVAEAAAPKAEVQTAPAEPPPPAAPTDDLPPRKIDSGVLAVLREEAEREAARRAAEAAAAKADAAKAETPATAPEPAPAPSKPAKPELTVVEPTPPNAPPVETDDSSKSSALSAVAKLQAAIATKPVEADSKPQANVAATDAAIAAVLAASLGDDASAANRQGKGRELLPDIEEIKSSLRSTVDDGAEETDNAGHDPAAAQEKRHGFRRGFISAMVVGLLLSSLYVSAPRIVAAVPALAGPMESYVASVNSARIYLDSLLRSATRGIEGEG